MPLVPFHSDPHKPYLTWPASRFPMRSNSPTAPLITTWHFLKTAQRGYKVPSILNMTPEGTQVQSWSGSSAVSTWGLFQICGPTHANESPKREERKEEFGSPWEVRVTYQEIIFFTFPSNTEIPIKRLPPQIPVSNRCSALESDPGSMAQLVPPLRPNPGPLPGSARLVTHRNHTYTLISYSSKSGSFRLRLRYVDPTHCDTFLRPTHTHAHTNTISLTTMAQNTPSTEKIAE